MIKKTLRKFSIDAVLEQVLHNPFQDRLVLNETDGNLFSGPYRIKQEFVGTPIGDLLEQIGPVGEARLLKLKSGKTYTAHTDPDDRLHLAIQTNKFSYLLDLDSNIMHHIPADGYLYEMDTSKTHIAANFGGDDRVHLNIRCLLPEFKSPGYRLVFAGVDNPDWKQQLYIDIMGYINQAVKSGAIQGIAKVNDRELLVNCDQGVLDYLKAVTQAKGFEVSVIPV